ncbi:MAG: sigma-70 family RNA polymerase sigma factor [Phycisphaerales bacterium]|nr:sigma-70 family RNA polymerase sigma factor [Phycisphaerales bacterium]
MLDFKHEPVAATLLKIQDGDRNAAAQFITSNAPLIRRRFRHKLGRAMRRVFDSQELISTVSRRLDRLVRQGMVRAVNERQLWSLVFDIAEHAVIDKARTLRRLEKVEAQDSPFANMLRSCLLRDDSGQSTETVELGDLFESLPDPVDREILALWLNGTTHLVTSQLLELPHATVRKRWERIKDKCRDRLATRGVS